MVYTKRTSRMNFYINEKKETITVKLKWKYYWKNTNRISWTILGKLVYQKKIEDLIEETWNNKLTLKSIGFSDFAKKHRHTVWRIKFKIQTVSANQHWDVTVTKIPLFSSMGSGTLWNSRRIHLDSEDVVLRERIKGPLKLSYFQKGAAHEIGHALGNTVYVPSIHREDEYFKTSSYLSDRKSIMNVGMEIRDRHKDYIVQQLANIVPNTIFE